MKHYLIKKETKIISIKYEDLSGLSFKPTTDIFVDDGVLVKKIVIFKPLFIELVLKKKIKNKLNLYLSLLLEDIDDDGDEKHRDLYQDVLRYKDLVLKRYGKYLDKDYLSMLLTKISIIQNELEANFYYMEEETKTR